MIYNEQREYCNHLLYMEGTGKERVYWQCIGHRMSHYLGHYRAIFKDFREQQNMHDYRQNRAISISRFLGTPVVSQLARPRVSAHILAKYMRCNSTS